MTDFKCPSEVADEGCLRCMSGEGACMYEAKAAANKAAEEGGLPYGYHYEWASCITTDGPQGFKWVFEKEAPPEWAVQDGQARNVIPLFIAADRASRQVANKAEVEPWYMTRLHDMGTVYKADGTMVAQTYGASAKAFMDAHNASLATPPATTGASTVLKDERIKAIFLSHGFTIKEGLSDLKPYVYAAAHAVAREVAAQAGQGPSPEFGQEVTRLVAEIRKPCSMAWRDSLVEQLIELIDPQPGRLP